VALAGLSLRPYRPTDFETLYRIDQACFPKQIAYGPGELRIYLHSDGSHCIVAEVGATIAGFVLTERAGQVAHIVTLDVLEPYRRQSVGSLLLSAAEDEAAARGANRVYLETATTNHAAIALWKKHGYRETGTIEDYYGVGHDAFEMQKRLARKSQAKAIP